MMSQEAVGKKVKQNLELSTFSGGPVVRNRPANSEDAALIPGLRRSHMPWGNESHEPQLLRPCPRALELQLLKLLYLQFMLCNKRSHHNEKSKHHNKRVAPAYQNYRKPSLGNEDPAQTKKIFVTFFLIKNFKKFAEQDEINVWTDHQAKFHHEWMLIKDQGTEHDAQRRKLFLHKKFYK